MFFHKFLGFWDYPDDKFLGRARHSARTVGRKQLKCSIDPVRGGQRTAHPASLSQIVCHLDIPPNFGIGDDLAGWFHLTW
jgi:hypothetical protein